MSGSTKLQGDLGEASAMQWLLSQRASVFVPFGHAPDADLVAVWNGQPALVQVKTTRRFKGDGRWEVMLSTRGGNQSWSGLAKLFDASRCDYLFVLVADGRRWFIPTADIPNRQGMVVGCPKWASYEIDPGTPFGDGALDSPAARWGTEAVKRGGL